MTAPTSRSWPSSTSLSMSFGTHSRTGTSPWRRAKAIAPRLGAGLTQAAHAATNFSSTTLAADERNLHPRAQGLVLVLRPLHGSGLGDRAVLHKFLGVCDGPADLVHGSVQRGLVSDLRVPLWQVASLPELTTSDGVVSM